VAAEVEDGVVAVGERSGPEGGTDSGESRVPAVHWARTRDGVDIAYQDFGVGPISLVVMHGWVSHLEVYWEQPRYARFMRRLAAGMRVIVFDKRGIGMSDRLTGDVALETRVDDVRAVMDHAGVDQAAVLGWGAGAPALAAFFAATHPERVTALFIDSEVNERRSPEWPLGSLTDEEFESELEGELATWGQHLASGYEGTYDDPSFVDWNGRMARFAATPASYEAFARVMFATDVTGVLSAIRVPTLVIEKHDNPAGGPGAAAFLASRIPGAQVATTPGTEGVIWFDEPEPFVGAVESFLGLKSPAVAVDRVLTTVLFTDIVESTSQAAAMGDAPWTALLEEHDVRTRREVERHRGRFINSTGDGLLAVFDGPARAVRSAQAMARTVGELGLQLRAGCHTGEVELHGADVRGITVHTAARIAALAAPSQVLVSSTIKDLTAGSGLVFEDAGQHELKGVPDRWHLYRVAN
jgi:class 3 adenylate cyclase/pimeloyl-ACP methyl ester carboxylesterase